MKTGSKNILLLGASFETGNMGVSALGASLIKIIEVFQPESDIILLVGAKESKVHEVCIGNRWKTVKTIHYRLNPRSGYRHNIVFVFLAALLYRLIPLGTIRRQLESIFPALEALVNAELVGDIRGGDSFSDIYGVKQFLIGSLPDLTSIVLGRRFVLFPQTYGPYKTAVARIITRFIIRRSSFIMARDRDSYRLVENMLKNHGPRKIQSLCPDVAFMLDPIYLENPDIRPPLNMDENRKIIGLNVSGLLYNGGYTRSNMFDLKLDYREFLHDLSKALLDYQGTQLLLVPHTFAPHGNVESDPDACLDLFETLNRGYPERVHIVAAEYNQSELKGIIGRCDFFIGSRMHACIAALSQDIPSVGIAYSKKFRGVFQTVGKEDMVVDAREVDHRTGLMRILQIAEEVLTEQYHTNIEVDVQEKILQEFQPLFN